MDFKAPHEEIKEKFKKKMLVKALIVPVGLMKTLNTQYKEFLFNMPKHPAILKELLPNNCKKVLLNLDLSKKSSESWPEKLSSFISTNDIKMQDHEILLSYEDYTFTEILQEILPKDVTIPSGFEIVGSIAHLNLQKAQLSHKKLIAKVLLDKNPPIKTVVNKTEALSNVFRTPELEILAGVNNLETEVKEGKCFFKLAYDKVYWNSTLQAERDRMLTFFQENEVILDLFCGVGPLSIRAAKKGCFVIANDLNPHCYEYLKENVKINHVSSKIICANLDARECFNKFIAKEKNEINEKDKYFDHVYMNLPGDAIQFLDVFFGFLKKCDQLWLEKEMPLIHVYSFSESDEVKSRELLGKRIKNILPNFENKDMIHFHTIKDVSMNKKMFGITFRLNKEDALGNGAKKNKEVEKKEESKDEDVDFQEKIHKKVKLN